MGSISTPSETLDTVPPTTTTTTTVSETNEPSSSSRCTSRSTKKRNKSILASPTLHRDDIETEHEDIYDCVDFYKQPAFNHPRLKNHTFHPTMRPSTSTNSLLSCKIKENLKLKDGGCPFESVPIRRVSKDEVYKINNFTKNYARTNAEPLPGTHFAVLETASDTIERKYTGVGGIFTTFDLYLEQSQYSSGVFIVQNGEDRIKVGWTVNPTLYQDSVIRLFQQLDAGESHCYNTLCPGFVSTRKDIPIDFTIVPNPKRGEVPHHFELHVHQDAENGHWWLSFCDVVIGFWPKQLFTKLSNSATYIAIGGEAYTPEDLPLPQTGNGYFPVPNFKLSAVTSEIILVDENHKIIDNPLLHPYVDNTLYGIIDAGVTTLFGRLIFYGGINT